jgi:hypothetical protein
VKSFSLVSFQGDRLSDEALSEQSTAWESRWGTIVILLAVLQFLLSAILDR